MYKIYDKWPLIAKEAYDSKQDLVDLKNIDHVIFVGMGGSGALGDFFSSILSKTKIHVEVTKGYHLPNTADSDTLVVATSVSGDTVETLSVLDASYKTGCKIVAFSSGGKMLQYCRKHNIEYRNVLQLHSPRTSFTTFLYTILKVLNSVIPVRESDIHDSISQLDKLGKKISSTNLNESNPSLNLAEWITGMPLIYYPFGLQAAAIRFKNSLQENTKMHSMAEDIIEACHNGIVAWEKPSNVKPILIQGKDDYSKTKDIWRIFKEYFKENQIDYREIFSVEGSILSKLVNLIYLLDYTSIYRAVLSGIDPTPIRSIDFVKRQLT
jgi:glucose/mannose-6-phosphate isomerase